MNTINKFGIASLACALSMGTAQATLITFDDQGFTALQDVTTQYASEGVTFSGVTDGGTTVNIEAANNGLFGDVNPYSPPISLSNFYGGSAGNRAHIMQIDFTSAASDVSFYYNPAGSSGVNTVFNVYDTAHNLLSSTSDPNASGDGVWYLETFNDANIGEVDIVSPIPGWGHYIDNLQFTSAAVPEASTTSAGIAGLGLAGFALLRRRPPVAGKR
jgi:hypothetical protein